MQTEQSITEATGPWIALDQITKRYGRLQALDRVSLEIQGGIVGLLGPNGAGKSTLIKVMLGLVRRTCGSGQILGFPLGSGARAIRDRVGYMPEDDCYIAGLTGIELVQFVARLSGLPAIEALRRGHEILKWERRRSFLPTFYPTSRTSAIGLSSWRTGGL